jgi:hypothetical protein
MGRPAKLSLSGWFRQLGVQDRPWVRDARCGKHQDLPWIADTAPSPVETLAMAAVCHGCPVILQCASYGLAAPGGFYAGVWIPWRQAGNEADTAREIRRWGRRQLQRITKLHAERTADEPRIATRA